MKVFLAISSVVFGLVVVAHLASILLVSPELAYGSELRCHDSGSRGPLRGLPGIFTSEGGGLCLAAESSVSVDFRF
jgi:hypothetical protein